MSSTLARRLQAIAPILARSASTQSSAVHALLKKNPSDVVITFAMRTPLGKAKKGQLKDVPVDALLSGLLKV